MMKKGAVTAVILCLVLLTSCSVQKRTDTYGFCERVNSEYKSEILNPSGYYINDKNEYNYFSSLNEARNAAVTLRVTDENTVNCVQITVTKEQLELSDEEKDMLFNCFFVMCRALLTVTEEEMLEDFNSVGFSAEKLGFSPSDIVFEVTGGKASVFMNEEIISMYCEKQ